MPVLPWLQAGAGLLQAGIGAVQAGKAQRQLSQLKTPAYKPSQSIADIYNKALQRYSVNPYSSAFYKMQTQNISRGLATGINALQSRRGALAGISGLMQGYNDANLRAVAGAEQEGSQKFGELTRAAGMKTSDDRQAFEINEMLPYNQKYNLLAMKASGKNQLMNAGLNNIFGGLGSLADQQFYKELYGTKATGDTQNIGGSSTLSSDEEIKRFIRTRRRY